MRTSAFGGSAAGRLLNSRRARRRAEVDRVPTRLGDRVPPVAERREVVPEALVGLSVTRHSLRRPDDPNRVVRGTGRTGVGSRLRAGREPELLGCLRQVLGEVRRHLLRVDDRGPPTVAVGDLADRSGVEPGGPLAAMPVPTAIQASYRRGGLLSLPWSDERRIERSGWRRRATTTSVNRRRRRAR